RLAPCRLSGDRPTRLRLPNLSPKTVLDQGMASPLTFRSRFGALSLPKTEETKRRAVDVSNRGWTTCVESGDARTPERAASVHREKLGQEGALKRIRPPDPAPGCRIIESRLRKPADGSR